MTATAKSFFHRYVVPEQRQIIDLLTTLSNEIQEETRNHKIGTVLYSVFGIVGGLAVMSAPFTAGSSVAMYGSSVVVCSYVADYCHSDVRESVVKNKLMYASESLYEYSQTCIDLFQHMMIDDDSINDNIWFLQELRIESQTQSKLNVHDFVFFLKSTIRLAPSKFKALISEKIHIDQLIAFIGSLKQSIQHIPNIPKGMFKMLHLMKGSLTLINELQYIKKQVSAFVVNYKVLGDLNNGKKCVEAMRLDYIVNKIERQFIYYV